MEKDRASDSPSPLPRYHVPMPPISPLSRLLRIAGALVIAGGAIFAFLASREIGEIDTVEAWPITTGTVLESRVDHTPEGFEPRVRYRYILGGSVHRGERIAREPVRFEERAEADSFAARYRPDALATVYFNPSDPTDSLLIRIESRTSDRVRVTAGYILIAVGFGLVLFAMWRG